MVVVLMAKTKREDGEIVDMDIPGVTDILLPIRHEEDTGGAAGSVPKVVMEDADGGMEAVPDIGIAMRREGPDEMARVMLRPAAHVRRRHGARLPGSGRERDERERVQLPHLRDDELRGVLHVVELELPPVHAPAGVQDDHEDTRSRLAVWPFLVEGPVISTIIFSLCSVSGTAWL